MELDIKLNIMYYVVVVFVVVVIAVIVVVLVAVVWNNLPYEAKVAESLSSFQRTINQANT